VNEEGENGVFSAFFWGFFIRRVIHFVSIRGGGGASIKLLEQVGNQYCQANNNANECFPVLKHDLPTPIN
jgi:hypothetical protein